MYTLSFSSHIAAPASLVWAHASSLRGVNYELWPLHMSGPQDLQIDRNTPLGRPLFRSVLTLFRVLPFDIHELALQNVAPGEWFHESSRSLLQKRWVHVRRVLPAGAGCVVQDELSFAPRVPVLGFVAKRLVKSVFERRHRRLKRRFGEARASAAAKANGSPRRAMA
jgi:ligand-binding SRPBCC domain-containing protein